MKCLKRFLLLALTITATSSFAADDQKGWVGAGLGLSIPNQDNTSTRGIYGITAGAKLGSEIGLGGYYFASSKAESSNGVSFDFNYSLIGAELTYQFEGEAKGVYFGGRLGISRVENKPSTSTTTYSASPFHYGAVVGYNHFINSNFSLGGDASYMMVDHSTATVAGVQTDVNKSFGMINLMFAGKFWF